MANYDFATNVGTTVSFNPVYDMMTFGSTYRASQLRLVQDGSDVVVWIGSAWLRLGSVSIGSFTSWGDFSFANNSSVKFDTAGNDSLVATYLDDYLDIRKGGSDTADAGWGDDYIYAGAGLSSGDVVTGGGGYDEMVLSGNYATTVTFGATTVTGVEVFRIEAGSTVRLALDAATVSSASSFFIDARAQLTGDLLYVDGSTVTAWLEIAGGAGNDTIITGAAGDYVEGGDGDDTISGGVGEDYIYAGDGDDTIYGGDDIDYIWSDDGNDIIHGGGGDDNALWGNGGDDQIFGDDGDDMIFGNEGDDIMDGGAGADVFVLGNYGGPQGSDQVDGFNIGEDTFWLQGLGAFTGLSEAGGNTTLTYAYGTVQVNAVTGLTLGDWNDLRNFWYEYAPPEIISDGGGATAEVAILEGEVAVTTVTTIDLNPWDASWFTITGGDDAALFGIDNWTGELVFLAAPDFEGPADADSDNVYEVIVSASDGVFTDTQAISVTVEDNEERGGHEQFSRPAGLGASLDGWKFGGIEQFALHSHSDFSFSTTDWLV